MGIQWRVLVRIEACGRTWYLRMLIDEGRGIVDLVVDDEVKILFGGVLGHVGV